jgi:hypothetical protein
MSLVPSLPLFEIARVLMRLDHVARFIVNANHSKRSWPQAGRIN